MVIPLSGEDQADEEREGEDEYFYPHNLVLALLAPLLRPPSDTEGRGSDADIACRNSAARDESTEAGEAAYAAQHHVGFADSSARGEKDGNSGSSDEGVGLDGVVLDDDSPFIGLFTELGLLERVCDADWVCFKPIAGRGSGSGRLAATHVDGVDGQLPGEDGPLPSPLSSMLMHP